MTPETLPTPPPAALPEDSPPSAGSILSLAVALLGIVPAASIDAGGVATGQASLNEAFLATIAWSAVPSLAATVAAGIIGSLVISTDDASPDQPHEEQGSRLP